MSEKPEVPAIPDKVHKYLHRCILVHVYFLFVVLRHPLALSASVSLCLLVHAHLHTCNCAPVYLSMIPVCIASYVSHTQYICIHMHTCSCSEQISLYVHAVCRRTTRSQKSWLERASSSPQGVRSRGPRGRSVSVLGYFLRRKRLKTHSV